MCIINVIQPVEFKQSKKITGRYKISFDIGLDVTGGFTCFDFFFF